jgi:hypothetical protein
VREGERGKREKGEERREIISAEMKWEEEEKEGEEEKDGEETDSIVIVFCTERKGNENRRVARGGEGLRVFFLSPLHTYTPLFNYSRSKKNADSKGKSNLEGSEYNHTHTTTITTNHHIHSKIVKTYNPHRKRKQKRQITSSSNMDFVPPLFPLLFAFSFLFLMKTLQPSKQAHASICIYTSHILFLCCVCARVCVYVCTNRNREGKKHMYIVNHTRTMESLFPLSLPLSFSL